MKKKLVLLITIFIVMILSLCTCTKKEKDPSKVIQYLKSLNSYTCDVEVHIKNNIQEIDHLCKQFYHKEYGHRLDINKDRVLIYRENDISVKDLNNNSQYTLDKNFDSVYKLSFIGEYIGLLYTNEEIKYSFETIEDKMYQLIYLDIPGNNSNISSAIMYVNLENDFPDKIVIYNRKEKECIRFVYKNFSPNTDIQEEIFKEQINNEQINNETKE
ncbi:germination lipoprotein GerS-related protein [Clostridium aestuarii]|uniref:Germination lipoprotein GerS-related protein n=1 Tax=Clostridium aestuarii TaxID=338193 RepID=A0ABT4CWF2_9CLOT|nr:germination lipoprotein GerS-related protein [Clostridium aestuarii]MCY6483315.1 germination lipoprotein GerS-related protein [Clostridium aestuarii]